MDLLKILLSATIAYLLFLGIKRYYHYLKIKGTNEMIYRTIKGDIDKNEHYLQKRK